MNYIRQRRERILIGDEDKPNRLVGGRFDDDIIGGCKNDTLKGHRGDDYIVGGGGSNKVRGGAGADIFVLSFDGRMVIRDYDLKEGDVITLPLYSSYEDMEWKQKRNGKYILYCEDELVAKFTNPFNPDNVLIAVLD